MNDPEEALSMSQSGSSHWEALSARGQNVDNEDDELFYIPERRPSLDLGPEPMDTSQWHHVEQARSPAQSYKSMTSEASERVKDEDDEDKLYTRVQLDRSDSYSSYDSFDSDDSEKRSPNRGKEEEDGASEATETSEVVTTTNEFSHPSLTVPFTFTVICDTLKSLSAAELRLFKAKLWKNHPQLFLTSPQHMDPVDLVDRLLERYSLEDALQISKDVFVEMQLSSLVDGLQNQCLRNEVRYEIREILRKKYGESDVGGKKRPFDELYTDLCISALSDNGPNIEHEVMTIEKLSTNTEENQQLFVEDILAAEDADSPDLKFVLLTGVAGSGKSTLVQRLILDWTEGRSHQHVTFLLPFTFRELQQFQDTEVSLLSIMHELYPPTRKLQFCDLTKAECNVMLIFDGLDEYKDQVDFFNTDLYGSFPDPTTLNVIVVNLLRARLLFHGLFLVTTRSQVKHSIPWDVHCREIQLQGFCDAGKDEYFRKRFEDGAQAERVISHVKSVKTLHIMCHLPLFCSLVADECQRVFAEQGADAELPRSLTYMYTKLMLVLIRDHRTFRAPVRSAEDEREFLMDVGKLAFNMLEEGTFCINKSYDWESHGVDDNEVVDHSGIGTEFFIKPQILYREKAFSFLHPTMQEYMAALYVFLSFTNQGRNIFENRLKKRFKGIFMGPKIMELYKSALNRSLQCEDGKLDIFLRFLFGMLARTNLDLLQPFCHTSLQWPTAASDAAALINKMVRESQNPNRIKNLQHCLEDMGV